MQVLRAQIQNRLQVSCARAEMAPAELFLASATFARLVVQHFEMICINLIILALVKPEASACGSECSGGSMRRADKLEEKPVEGKCKRVH